MDLGSIFMAVGMLLMFYFIAPRWVSKLIKQLMTASLGEAMLTFFSGMEYTSPETGETFELSPQEAALVFFRDVVSTGMVAATAAASQEVGPFMASLHSESAAKKLKDVSPVALGFSRLPKGQHGLQAAQRTFKEVMENVAPAPKQGTIFDTLLQAGRVANVFGVDVGKMISKGGAEAAAGAVAKPATFTGFGGG